MPWSPSVKRLRLWPARAASTPSHAGKIQVASLARLEVRRDHRARAHRRRVGVRVRVERVELDGVAVAAVVPRHLRDDRILKPAVVEAYRLPASFAGRSMPELLSVQMAEMSPWTSAATARSLGTSWSVVENEIALSDGVSRTAPAQRRPDGAVSASAPDRRPGCAARRRGPPSRTARRPPPRKSQRGWCSASSRGRRRVSVWA